MAEFSISNIIRPFVAPANRSFDKATNYIASKHPLANPEEINHDLKALVFDGASALLVSAVALAYFRIIYLTTAIALIGVSYLLRRIVDETLPKANNEQGSLKEAIEETTDLMKKAGLAKGPSVTENIKPYFYREDEIFIGSVVLLKLPYQPLLKFLGMISSRSPV